MKECCANCCNCMIEECKCGNEHAFCIFWHTWVHYPHDEQEPDDICKGFVPLPEPVE